ncbi:MAG: nucleotidyltransferase family protein [Acidimicrobiia bacterium]|nr:nucleotidyltransferase family protein [Acidimicrobiia bacterium]
MLDIVGVVLAAGASERMERPKLLLPYGGRSIVAATVEAFLAAGLDAVVVVTGHGAAEVERSIEGLPVEVARNPDPDRGTMSSLLTGVASVPAAAFVYAPGDLPTMSSDVISAVAGRWRSDGSWAAITKYRDRVGHPFLVSSAAIEEFSGEHGDGVLWRGLVESRDDRVDTVEVGRDAPVDVNTPSDYEALTSGDARIDGMG